MYKEKREITKQKLKDIKKNTATEREAEIEIQIQVRS